MNEQTRRVLRLGGAFEIALATAAALYIVITGQDPIFYVIPAMLALGGTTILFIARPPME
ncbi:MAG: hypothetical protein AAF752_14890 [Bacteroidota bacterium]